MTDDASKLITFGQYFSDQLNEVTPFLRRVVRPIFEILNPRQPQLIGSCVFLEIGDSHFLITASHVVRRASSPSNVFIGGDKPVPIQGTGFETLPYNLGGKDIDAYDLLVLEMSDDVQGQLGNVSAVPLSSIDIRDANDSTKRQCLFGYPGSKNRTARRFNRSRNKFSVSPLPLETVLKSNFDFSKVGGSQLHHHAIQFSKRHYGHPPGFSAPDPYGMSGGGLWYFPDLVKPKPILLCGLLIEWHPNLGIILAVKMRYVLSRIASHFPAVRDDFGNAGFSDYV